MRGIMFKKLLRKLFVKNGSFESVLPEIYPGKLVAREKWKGSYSVAVGIYQGELTLFHFDPWRFAWIPSDWQNELAVRKYYFNLEDFNASDWYVIEIKSTEQYEKEYKEAKEKAEQHWIEGMRKRKEQREQQIEGMRKRKEQREQQNE